MKNWQTYYIETTVFVNTINTSWIPQYDEEIRKDRGKSRKNRKLTVVLT